MYTECMQLCPCTDALVICGLHTERGSLETAHPGNTAPACERALHDVSNNKTTNETVLRMHLVAKRRLPTLYVFSLNETRAPWKWLCPGLREMSIISLEYHFFCQKARKQSQSLLGYVKRRQQRSPLG